MEEGVTAVVKAVMVGCLMAEVRSPTLSQVKEEERKGTTSRQPRPTAAAAVVKKKERARQKQLIWLGGLRSAQRWGWRRRWRCSGLAI
jgi:hypothetical protein